jgi:hypothetical protein
VDGRVEPGHDEFMVTAGNILILLGLSALVGGMLFFGAVVAPLVFTKLAPDVSGPFIRAVFPFYYGFVGASAAVAGLGYLLRGQTISAFVMLVVLVAVLWAWLWLIPYLNAVRDAGNMAAFDRGHKFSTWLNGAELVAALWLLVRSALTIG